MGKKRSMHNTLIAMESVSRICVFSIIILENTVIAIQGCAKLKMSNSIIDPHFVFAHDP